MIIHDFQMFTRLKTFQPGNVRPRMSTMFYSAQSEAEERWVKNSHGKLFKVNFQNENFEKFYAAQSVCSEEDFPKLLSSCRRGLPSVFRVVKHRPNSHLLIDRLKAGHMASLGATPVPWYGDSLVWRLDNTRWNLRDEEQHRQLHQWLVAEDRMGNIYRQEQVSMVPVRCLDIEPHHVVLDMCASPGSKTGQVLEALHSSPLLPTGCVLANEFCPARSTNLYGNMREFQSPCLAVTQHPGQAFPDLTWPDGKKVQYDHVVCDVPCSGDGTIRKNPNIWAHWHPARGNGRFNLQVNIARRGVELLKVGGTIAYSSCSINQIENEAVIAQLLREAGDSLELVDMTGRFPGLSWLPGLSQWKVFDREMREFHSMDQVPLSLTPQISQEMFPPTEEEKLKFCLHKSMRFLPHLNDDGGFFVAILRKTGHIEPKPVHKIRADRKEEKRKKVKHSIPKIDHFIKPLEEYKFIDDDPQLKSEVTKSKEFLGLDLPSKNMFRLQNSNKNIRLVSDSLRGLLHDGNKELKTGGTPGTNIMCRSNMSCRQEVPFHPRNSALPTMGKYISKRQISASLSDTLKLFTSKQLDETSIDLSELSSELKDKLSQLSPGWILYSLSDQRVSFSCVGYISATKMFLMISKRELDHYLFLLNLH